MNEQEVHELNMAYMARLSNEERNRIIAYYQKVRRKRSFDLEHADLDVKAKTAGHKIRVTPTSGSIQPLYVRDAVGVITALTEFKCECFLTTIA